MAIIDDKGITTVNPTNDKELKTYPFMTDEQATAAVAKCHAAFKQWRTKSSEERAQVLKKVGENLKKNKDEFVDLMIKEMGKLKPQGEDEVDLCAAICDYTANNGPKELEDEERELPNGGRGMITHSPIGVIYGIQPWNFPLYQVIRYTIANLMAGNGVLLKHAEGVTGTGLLIERVLKDAGLPENLFTVLVISHEQSDKIIENEQVRGVTFTGSPKGGKIVAQKAAAQLKKTVLELGSNDGYVVLDDADVDKAVEWCVKGRIYNNGETCVAAKRFIVTEKNFEAFRDKYVEKMKKVRVGDPADENTQLGPMARKELRDDLHEQVEKSVKNGAKILCGGEIPTGEGCFYPATVLVDVKPGQPAYDDELFGPVASIIKAEDDEDAMRIANDSRYGLGGGIFCKDEERAFELAKNHFDTGMVFINSFGMAQPNMPFGGVKNSGYGREHGGFGLKEFVNSKAVMHVKG